ncbi:NAD(P)-dependent oxidoreductase [Enterovirga rhinocerotis]|uniref:2-hydroxy-3-oxopropionate reductase n=1 Tax=Enterovirga rhinocerotis TaxID=1339210 RepID=A0A4R7C8M2_9HYPH|nr:NAD(P)-dependent oxidoreductase [Enterovirga rhinocerotis]TDR94990.1 2-hydroxy-3-oxopropionate reductase [Enterovirga rhinocerotis]
MTDTKGPVGFIGLGAMGAAMAERLAEAGIPLLALDRNQAALDAFVARGATACATPAEVADGAEVVFCCLPKAAISREVALGADGIAKGRRARVVVETSTIGKQAMEPIAAGLAAAGKALVDCPISGGPRGARAGTLAAIVSGAAVPIEAARPYLEIMAKNVFVVGDEPGQAQVMKLVNNLISAANMASAFEALVIGAKAGLDPDMMVQVINVSTGRNSATLDKVPQSVLTGSFDYGARLDILYKDINLGLSEAEALGVPTWTLNAVTQLFRHGVMELGGEKDFTSLIRLVEGWAGAEVRSRAATDRDAG